MSIIIRQTKCQQLASTMQAKEQKISDGKRSRVEFTMHLDFK